MKKISLSLLSLAVLAFVVVIAARAYSASVGPSITGTQATYVVNDYMNLNIAYHYTEPDPSYVNGQVDNTNYVYSLALVSSDRKTTIPEFGSYVYVNYDALARFNPAMVSSGTYFLRLYKKSADGNTLISTTDSNPDIIVYKTDACELSPISQLRVPLPNPVDYALINNTYVTDPINRENPHYSSFYYTSKFSDIPSDANGNKPSFLDYKKVYQPIDMGISWFSPAANVQGTVPLYRMRGNDYRDFLYTTSQPELNSARGSGYVSDGVLAYIFDKKYPGTVPLSRYYDARFGVHKLFAGDDTVNVITDTDYQVNGTNRVDFNYTKETILGYVYKSSNYSNAYRYYDDINGNLTYRKDCTNTTVSPAFTSALINSYGIKTRALIMQDPSTLTTVVSKNKNITATTSNSVATSTASSTVVVATTTPVVTQNPTSSLTVNGTTTVNVKPGDTLVYRWNSANGNHFSSTLSRYCTDTTKSSFVSWDINTAYGTLSTVVPDSLAGCNDTIYYYVENTTTNTPARPLASVVVNIVGGNSQLSLQSSVSPVPSSNVVINRNDGETINLVNFTVKSDGGDSKITGIRVPVTASGTLPTTLYLYNGSTLVQSRAVPSNGVVNFDNLSLVVGKGVAQSFLVKGQFPTNVVSGTVVNATVNSVTYTQPNGQSITNIGSSVVGAPQNFVDATVVINLASAPTIVAKNANLIAIFPMTIQAVGGNLIQPTNSDFAVKYGTTTSNLYGNANVAAVVIPNNNIADGSIANVTVTASIPVSSLPSSGNYAFMINSIKYNIGGTAGVKTNGLESFKTPSIYVDTTPTPVKKYNLVPMYRMYNSKYDDHFYTASQSDVATGQALNPPYVLEGNVGYISSTPDASTTPIYRLSSPSGHFYTVNKQESDTLVRSYGFGYEGITGYIFTTQLPGTVPLYRLVSSSRHFYTNNEAEAKSAAGYRIESIMGYVFTSPQVAEAPIQNTDSGFLASVGAVFKGLIDTISNLFK